MSEELSKDVKLNNTGNVMKSDNTFSINENTAKSNIYAQMMKWITIDREEIGKKALSLISAMKPTIWKIQIVNDNGDVKAVITKKNQEPVTIMLTARNMKREKMLDDYDVRGDKDKCFDLVDYCVDVIKEIDSWFFGDFGKSDIMAIMDKETLFGKMKTGTGSHGLMQITKRPILQISQEIKSNTPGYKNMFEKLFPGMTVSQLEWMAMNSARKAKDINNIKIGIMYLNFCAKNKINYTNFSSHKLGAKNMFTKNHPEQKEMFDQKWSEYISILSSNTAEWNRLKNVVQTSAKYNGNGNLKYNYGLYVWFVSKYLYNEYNK